MVGLRSKIKRTPQESRKQKKKGRVVWERKKWQEKKTSE